MASVYGWTHHEILALTARQFFLYLKEVNAVEARKQMMAFEVASFPNMEKRHRQGMLRPYELALNPDPTHQETDEITIERSWNQLRSREVL